MVIKLKCSECGKDIWEDYATYLASEPKKDTKWICYDCTMKNKEWFKNAGSN